MKSVMPFEMAGKSVGAGQIVGLRVIGARVGPAADDQMDGGGGAAARWHLHGRGAFGGCALRILVLGPTTGHEQQRQDTDIHALEDRDISWILRMR